MQNIYDTIIVGGGPAGLSAAHACGKRQLKTLLRESHSKLEGLQVKVYPKKIVTDYSRAPSILTEELARIYLCRYTRQALLTWC